MSGRVRVHVLCGHVGDAYDAIRDYAVTLSHALREHEGVDAVVFSLGERRRWRALDGTNADPRVADAVLVQYNPFAFGHWGLAPWLPARLARWRRGGLVVGIIVHEDHVPVESLRSAAMSGWQRLQLAVLLATSDPVIATCEERRSGLPRRVARRLPIIPVGSNLPDAREDARAEPGRFVVAAFGRSHPSRLIDYASEAVDAIAAARGPVTLLNLGAGAPPVPVRNRDVDVVTPGPLPAAELAARLASADLVLLPFINGAITNRTTLMAALQQGRAVLSTRGRHTDRVLDDGRAPILVDVADRVGFAAAAARLALDDELRGASARAGRALYEREFAWPVIARRMADALRAAGASP